MSTPPTPAGPIDADRPGPATPTRALEAAAVALAATIAVADVVASTGGGEGHIHPVAVALAGAAAVVVLLGALVTRAPAAVAAVVLVLGGGWVAATWDRLDVPTTTAVATGLLVMAELAWWATERPLGPTLGAGARRDRTAWVAGLAVASVVVVPLTATPLAPGPGLATTLIACAAVLVLVAAVVALVDRLGRRRPPTPSTGAPTGPPTTRP